MDGLTSAEDWTNASKRIRELTTRITFDSSTSQNHSPMSWTLELPSREDLKNESDVEQKLIAPLLLGELPLGFGYRSAEIYTKQDLRQFQIDKGNRKVLYYPDYVVAISGVPLVVIEAKRPFEDVEEALREARLYAHALNGLYPQGLNPCRYTVASDGYRTVLGTWDSDEIVCDIQIEDIDVLNAKFAELHDLLNRVSLTKEAQAFREGLRGGTQFSKPVRLLGGKGVQEEVVSDNSFGSNLSIEYQYLFNPQTQEDRRLIARNAYVSSKRKLAHVQPIDRIIRATIPPSHKDARLVDDTGKPTEIVEVVRKTKQIRHQVILLIGNVGAGKSTFMDYLREVALPRDIVNTVGWALLDMNAAPVDSGHVYDWILTSLLDDFANHSDGEDLGAIATIQKVFSKAITDHKKGPLAILDSGTPEYRTALYEYTVKLTGNKVELLKAYIDYYFSNRGKSYIVILDNTDKRSKDEQLLMFEVSNWIRSTFRCTVVLPLRESTYDQYRNHPPLDTVVKDYVFRIDPPLLEQVIYKRLEYASREVLQSTSTFHYHLRNGSRVECRREEVINYFGSITHTLFQNNFFKRLIVGLSERDIRRGIEIVLDFCKSGHILEENIFRMRMSNTFSLPNHLVIRILLRNKRRYYKDSASRVKSVFFSDVQDILPDPFVRADILSCLEGLYHVHGPNKTKGFHKAGDIIKTLQTVGHDPIRTRKELAVLIEAQCVVTESQTHEFDDEDLICITSAGMVHLELTKNRDYLSAMAEDFWFREGGDADRVRKNIAGRDTSSQFTYASAVENGMTLIHALQKYRSHFPIHKAHFVKPDIAFTPFNLEEVESHLKEQLDQNAALANQLKLKESYPNGTVVEAQVTSVQQYGVFFEFGLEGRGYVHISKLTDAWNPTYIEENFEVGEVIEVVIDDYQAEHGRFNVRVVPKGD